MIIKGIYNFKNMNKKTFFLLGAIVLLIAFGVGGYFIWNKWKIISGKNAINKAGETANKIIETALKGVLPEMGVNPLENKPDINPADKFNPFKNIKINPFE